MKSGFYLYRVDHRDFYTGKGSWTFMISDAFCYDTLANAKAGAIPFRKFKIKIINVHVPTQAIDTDPLA